MRSAVHQGAFRRTVTSSGERSSKEKPTGKETGRNSELGVRSSRGLAAAPPLSGRAVYHRKTRLKETITGLQDECLLTRAVGVVDQEAVNFNELGIGPALRALPRR